MHFPVTLWDLSVSSIYTLTRTPIEVLTLAQIINSNLYFTIFKTTSKSATYRIFQTISFLKSFIFFCNEWIIKFLKLHSISIQITLISLLTLSNLIFTYFTCGYLWSRDKGLVVSHLYLKDYKRLNITNKIYASINLR